MMTSAEREAFLAEHGTIVGGSDIGAICNVNPFQTEMDIYMNKIGEFQSSEPNAAMRWGTILEPVILQEFCDQNNCKVIASPELRRLKDHPHIGYHADGLVLDADGEVMALFEAKTSGSFGRMIFGESGSDDIPDSYKLQVQWGMLVFDLPRAFVAVLIAGQDFRIFEIERDDELIGNMIITADNFWQRVIDRNPPEIDGTEASQRFLQSLYPKDTGETIRADTYLTEWVGRLAVARKEKAEAEKREQLAKNKVIEKMENASVLEGTGFKVSYKKPKDRTKVDWPAVAAAAKVPTGLIEKHTTITEAKRAFRPTWKE